MNCTSENQDIEQIKKELKNILSESRYIHSLGVMETAEKLAKIYNVNVEEAKMAGLLHDIAKEMTDEQFLEYVKEHSIKIDEIEEKNPKLLHGKVGADIAKNKYNVNPNIQNAIKYHTTTNKNMNELAKIIYVSDKIEPNRKNEDYDIETERKMAMQNLDQTIIFIIGQYIEKLVKKGKLIHPNAIETRNSLILSMGKEQI